MNSDLSAIVFEMRIVALQHKLTLETLSKRMADAESSPTRRCEMVDGHKMIIQLTFDDFLAMWHLSFSIEGHEPMPFELVEKIKTAFLGDEPVIEIKSTWGPSVKQFLQKANL